MNNKSLKNNKDTVLMFAAMLYAGFLIVLPIFGMYIVKAGPLTVQAGFFISILCYLMMDVLNDLYPKEKIMSVLNLGSFIRPLIYILAWVLLMLPLVKNKEAHDMISKIFEGSTWLLIVGIVTQLIGQYSNTYLFKYIAKLTRGRVLVARIFSASFLGSCLGSITHALIGYQLGSYLGLMPGTYPVLEMIISGIIARAVFVTFISTPVSTAIIMILRKFGYTSMKDTEGQEI